nr:unnamed protein product [Digitaria exilis]
MVPDRFMLLRSRDTTAGFGADEQLTPLHAHGVGSLASQLSRWCRVSIIWLFNARRSQPSWFKPWEPEASRKPGTPSLIEDSGIKESPCYDLLGSNIPKEAAARTQRQGGSQKQDEERGDRDQEHTAAHLPEADLPKAGELFTLAPARAGELPRTVLEPRPRPTKQQGQQRRAPGGDTLELNSPAAAAADAGVVVLRRRRRRRCCRRLGRARDASTGGEGMDEHNEGGSRMRAARRSVDGGWSWREEEEEKRNWKLGMAGKHAFKLPSRSDGGRSNRGRLLSLSLSCFRCLCFSTKVPEPSDREREPLDRMRMRPCGSFGLDGELVGLVDCGVSSWLTSEISYRQYVSARVDWGKKRRARGRGHRLGTETERVVSGAGFWVASFRSGLAASCQYWRTKTESIIVRTSHRFLDTYVYVAWSAGAAGGGGELQRQAGWWSWSVTLPHRVDRGSKIVLYQPRGFPGYAEERCRKKKMPALPTCRVCVRVRDGRCVLSLGYRAARCLLVPAFPWTNAEGGTHSLRSQLTREESTTHERWTAGLAFHDVPPRHALDGGSCSTSERLVLDGHAWSRKEEPTPDAAGSVSFSYSPFVSLSRERESERRRERKTRGMEKKGTGRRIVLGYVETVHEHEDAGISHNTD